MALKNQLCFAAQWMRCMTRGMSCLISQQVCPPNLKKNIQCVWIQGNLLRPQHPPWNGPIVPTLKKGEWEGERLVSTHKRPGKWCYSSLPEVRKFTGEVFQGQEEFLRHHCSPAVEKLGQEIWPGFPFSIHLWGKKYNFDWLIWLIPLFNHPFTQGWCRKQPCLWWLCAVSFFHSMSLVLVILIAHLRWGKAA